MNKLACIILAGGVGKRMNSKLVKVIHPLCGRKIIEYVVDTASSLSNEKIVVVVGYQGEDVARVLESKGVEITYQNAPLGTGDAVKQAQPLMANFEGDVLILCGDTPLLSTYSLLQFINGYRQSNVKAALLTVKLDDPKGYGRIIKDSEGVIKKIVEETDLEPNQEFINEVNTGIYCLKADILRKLLGQLSPNNKQKEYYFTDIIELLHKMGDKVLSIEAPFSEEVVGINDRCQLAVAEKILRRRINKQLQLMGVTIIDIESTFIDAQVKIGQDTIIYPFTIIRGDTKIGCDCHIGPYTQITNTQIADEVIVNASVVTDSVIGTKINIGPFAHIRQEVTVGDEVRIGNFVELKKSSIGNHTNIAHLSYIGDTTMGDEVNIGAGTIVCNYDGKEKHRTTIKDKVFVGSNTALVAPLRIGEKAIIGAGSTITEDVPDYALTLGRARQVIKPDWVKKDQKG